MKKKASMETKRLLGAVLLIALMTIMLHAPAFASETQTADTQQHSEAYAPAPEGLVGSGQEDSVPKDPAELTEALPGTDTDTPDGGGIAQDDQAADTPDASGTAADSQDAAVSGRQSRALPGQAVQPLANDTLTWSGPNNFGYDIYYYDNSSLPAPFQECVDGV